jgi:hypothetical protein
MGRSSRAALLFAMALAGAGFCQVPLDESGQKSTVNVVIVDSFGLPVDSAILYVQRIDAGDEGPKIRVERLPIDPLPYGTYRFTVENPGFESTPRVVTVHDKSCTVIIGLIPAEKLTFRRPVDGYGWFPFSLLRSRSTQWYISGNFF